MGAKDTEWSTLPYDPIRQLADNLWVVDGDLPGMPLRRRMLVVRLTDGSLLIHNGVAMSDADMEALEALGAPRYLVVPSAYHRMDAARFKARYPDLQVVCPQGARKAVEKKVAVDATLDALPPALLADASVELVHTAGSKAREALLVVHSGEEQTVVFNDAVFNLPHQKGFFWFVYGKLMGNTGGAKVTTVGRLFIIKDKKAMRAQLEALAARPGLRRVIVAHGDIEEADAAGLLRAVADTL